MPLPAATKDQSAPSPSGQSPPSDTRTLLVLGGRGFIGRHTVRALTAAGHRVIIGSRYAAKATATSAEQRQCRFQDLQQAASWALLLDGVDGVINCVGILRQRWGERYEAVHTAAPAALADACAERGLRLLHVSALGLHATAGSGFIRSKLAGEQALLASACEVVIVRPSLLDGSDGFGARWLRMLARFPVHLLPSSSRGQLACMAVDDLAAALAILAVCSEQQLREHAPKRWVELGGTETFMLRQYLQRLRGGNGRSWVIPIPHVICRAFSHLCDLFHLTPYSFGHLELLARDNNPQPNALPGILGREPTRISAWNQSKVVARPDLPLVPGEQAPSRLRGS